MPAELTLLEKAALLSGASVWETRAFPHAGIRSLTMSDGPHGIRKQLGSSDHLGLHASAPATCFPTAATVANSWDVELAEEVGEALGAEAAELGVDVVLGPGLNIKRSPLGGRNFEYFSEDPHLSGKLAAGYVRGIQSQGVAASPKHFAANSQEFRRMASDSVVDERTFREIYLRAFEIVVREAAPRVVMSSYNRINGTYAHENAHLLTTVLREDWGFDGAVVTDWGGGNDPVAGVLAGGTLEMPAPGFDSVEQILAAVADGRLTEADLDARVTEMVGLIARIEPGRARPVDLDAHHTLARRAAAAGHVLLRNEDGLLPLAPGTRVAVVGDFAATPRYQGAGSSLVNPTRLATTLDAVAGSGLDLVGHARGFTRGGEPDAALVREAVDAARNADVVLVYLGLDEVSESEGRDRTHLELPPNQIELLTQVRAVAERVVVVLSAGSVVLMPWLEDCDALLHGFLGGQAGAEATLDVLTGRVNPSGRLAETYPLALEDTPAHAYFPGREQTAEYREGLYVGYRYHTTAKVPVRFPFGYGLGYTTFAYADLEVTATGASFTVRNTGSVTGAEVAQLYVGLPGGAVHRPARELKGFAKVHLRPGEARTVTIPFDEATFRFFDAAAGAWRTEAGTYDVVVARHVEDPGLAGSFAVAGETITPATDLPSYAIGAVTAVPDAEFAALLGRPLPPARRAGTDLGVNDPLRDLHRARNPLARLVAGVLRRLIARADRKGKPDLNLYFLYDMPLRAVAKMTDGAVSTPMVEAILTIVNGRFLRGTGALVAAAVRTARSTRRHRRALARAAAPTGH